MKKNAQQYIKHIKLYLRGSFEWEINKYTIVKLFLDGPNRAEPDWAGSSRAPPLR